MKQFIAFAKKEMYHILRDQRTMLVILGMPIAQIIIFGFALSNEVKNTRIGIFDQANDFLSTKLIHKIESSEYFEFVSTVSSQDEINISLRKGDVQTVIIIPTDFSTALAHQNQTTIQLITDGTNPNLATTIDNYLATITRDFQMELGNKEEIPLAIHVHSRMLYNPQMNGAFNFVPGVIALILMLICTMMTSVSIVKEKELGNMEILLVSPMSPLSIIFSKAVPYIVLSLIILTIILGLSVFLLGVPIAGSITLLYLVSLIFIITALSLGLLISSFTNSQQVAMMISLMGMMLPTVMLSGFMFPIESMSWPLRLISNLVPAKWYFFSIQAIMIKGLGISAIIKEITILLGFTVLFLILSVRKFQIRLA